MILLLLVVFISSVSSQAGGDDVCYDGVGCFSQSAPWVSATRPLPPPASPDDIDMKLTLYTRNSKERFNISLGPPLGLKGSTFKIRKTVFMTHGFASSGETEWLQNMKNAYMRQMDVNVIIVDWEKGASSTNYFQAASNTRVVGALVGRALAEIVTVRKIPRSKIHLIGHSLGSHVMGYAAKNEINNTAPANATDEKRKTYRVRRITGLDPAQPAFENEPPEVRLDKDDAAYVDIVHSDAKLFVPTFGFGFISILGIVDYYLNAGSNQPGCNDVPPIDNVKSIDDLKNLTVEVISKAVACSHGRAYEIFIAALDPRTPCSFIGYRLKKETIPGVAAPSTPLLAETSCGKNGENCLRIGAESDKINKRGAFQIRTSKEAPFCCKKIDPVLGCVN